MILIKLKILVSGEVLPLNKLRPFLAKELGLIIGTDADVIVRRFTHGQSNPTYYIRVGEKELVLRKKPVQNHQQFQST